MSSTNSTFYYLYVSLSLSLFYLVSWTFFNSFVNLLLFSFQDAMVVILKSLVPGCLFNIIGFGSTYKSLFNTSQNYEEVKNKKVLISQRLIMK